MFPIIASNFKFKLTDYGGERINAREIAADEDVEGDKKKIKIYHITSDVDNSITWGDVKDITTPIGEQIPVSFEL